MLKIFLAIIPIAILFGFLYGKAVCPCLYRAGNGDKMRCRKGRGHAGSHFAKRYDGESWGWTHFIWTTDAQGNILEGGSFPMDGMWQGARWPTASGSPREDIDIATVRMP